MRSERYCKVLWSSLMVSSFRRPSMMFTQILPFSETFRDILMASELFWKVSEGYKAFF